MSLQGNLSSPFTPEPQDNEGGETKNNNKPACFVSQGDTNANAIQVEVTGYVGTPPPLVSQSDRQDKIDSWEMDSPVDDPDLEEFELLECQELEAFLEAEMEHHEKADEAMPVSELLSGQNIVEFNTATAEIMSDGQNDAHEEDKATSGGGRSISHFHSGNDALVSRLSASISGESTGQALATDSQVTSVKLNWAAQPIRTTSAKFGNLQRPSKSVVLCGMSMVQSSNNNLNRNSSTLSQEPSQDAPLEQASHGLKRGPAEQDSGTLINGAGKCQQKMMDTKERKHLQQQNTQEKEGGEHNARKKIYKPGYGVSSDPTTSERVQLSQQLLNRISCTETDKGLFAGRFVVESQSLHLISQSPERSSHKTNETVAEKPEQKTHHQGMSSHTEPKTVQKEHSGDHEQSTTPSSLENTMNLTPRSCDSPTSAMSHSTPKTIGSPKKRLLSPSKGAGFRISHPDLDNDQQVLMSGLKAPSKVCVSSGIPKPILHHPSKIMEKTELENSNERSPPPKPKNVRPKIITYIRKSPQVKPHGLEAPYEVSTLPTRLTAYTSSPSTKDSKALVDPRTSPVLSASNLLYDKYRQEMQKTRLFPTGLMVSGIRPPSHNIHPKLTGKPEGFCGDLPEGGRDDVNLGAAKQKDMAASQFGCHEAAGVFRAPRALRPQLGLGAVNRIPSMKNRMLLAGQKSALVVSQPVQAVTPISHAHQDPADQKKPTPVPAPKSFLHKPGQSGLRPPGYSRLAPARLAAFSFVRSASISSASSNQSNDSTRSDPCRPVNRSSCGNEDPQPSPKAAPAPNEAPRASSRSSPQPPCTPIPARRSLLPASRSSPVASRKEIQNEEEAPRPAVSSPKRFAVVSPRPQSPVHTRQKPVTARAPVASDPPRPGPVGGQDAEAAAAVKQLREQCQEQARRLLRLQAELRKATSCLEALAISTQHFCLKSNQATQKEKELSLELERIRDEVASSTSRWERLQRDKETLERSFERELQVLQTQQEAELGALEAGLRAQHMEEKEHLRSQHQAQLEELQNHQQDKIQDMTMNHEVAMEDMENSHNSAVVALREENEAGLRELRMTHEHQRKAMEENFEQIRLSLQDQVDTLTFQNRTLRDRAKRFEEALRRSTDEQIVDALAPYQHIEEDLKSLKDVLEMKNQQIHEQEKKICELEKLAQKNIFLEERVQVLQQQNEDLKARIDNNLALSRQLSEENANLQEHVEKESKEKKRLSRNNEELLWRLQTGEQSPRMLSPSSSPAHRGSPGATSPSWPQPLPR
ncbi:microtubule-associated tumor suppressor candidate 2 homolog isoform X2 [Paramormyrops kingsleyae]|uniref:microtubule-associated tumor suppressor candidate 2 homolog isoform X2 n=1 Tax=Paramormyrops kingsleyae TaxID=1676925 RepID=UPI000CD5EFDC|nr:microtubule-associated tumor suppressor candidate 2 homolog isoform X2 [Paramormyrops kingsleyae]